MKNNKDNIIKNNSNGKLEKKLSFAVEQSTNIIFITDILGNIEYVNKRFTDITGYMNNEIIGKNPRYFKSEIHSKSFYDNLWKTIKSGNVWKGEIQNRKKNGEIFWEKTTITPLKSENDEIINYLAVKEIITREKRFKKALLQSVSNFKNIFDYSIDTIIIHDFSGKMLDVNNAFCKRLGYSYIEAMKLKPEDFDLNENPDKFKDRIKEIKENGYSVFETISITKNKKKLYTEVNTKIIDFDGKKAFLSIGRDITERKKAKEELERSEKNYKILAEILNDVVARISKTGRLLYVSPRVRSFAGYEPAEELGKHISIYFSRKTELLKALKIITDVFLYKISGNFEFTYKPKNGKPFPVEVSYAPVVEDSKVVYVQLVMRDNSEKKKYEQELKIAKEEAEAGANMKAAFLANMSHEIRTPLNGLLGYADLLKNPDLIEEKKANYIDIINKSGNHLLNLLNDIIDISKIDAGHIEIFEKECKVNFCLLDLFNFFEDLISEKKKGKVKLIISYGIPVGEDTIYTDETKVRQIFTNLIGNAIKFTKKGVIHIESEIYKENYILFSVKDTGIGIVKEKQSSVFDRFKQEDESTTRNYGGTGLGLAISKAYSEMLGGKIWLESEKGKGSKFSFIIPYKKVKE